MGKVLNKTEQKKITGGVSDPIFADECSTNVVCYPGPLLSRGGQCGPSEVCVVFDFGAICQCID